MSTLLMIDGNSLANRAFYGVPHLSNSKGVPTNAVYGFLNMLDSMITQFKPDEIFVAFDVSKKVFRHERYADYKGTRSGMPEELVEQMPLIREALRHMNIETLGLEGYEADDIIGTMSRYNGEKGNRNIIVSGDRDLFQLVDEQTTVCFPKKGVSNMEEVTPELLAESYGLTPALVIEMKGLMGDKSDNIPGIAGIGEKTAKKFLDEYGSIEGLYDHLEEFRGKKMYEKLLAGRDDAYMSRELATIKRDVPIAFDELDVTYGEPDLPALLSFCRELELTKLVKKFEEMSVSTSKPELSTENAESSAVGVVYDSFQDALSVLGEWTPDEYTIIVDVDEQGRVTRFSWRHNKQNHAVALEEGDWKNLVTVIGNVLKDENTYLLTDDAKKLAKAILSAGGDSKRIVWDVAISDYILQPEGSDHTLERCSAIYLEKNLSADSTDFRFAALEVIEELRQVMQQALQTTNCIGLYRDIELPLVHVLSEMELRGIGVKTAYLEELQVEFDERIQTIEAQIEELAGESFNVNSPKQLGHILFEVLGLPVVKKTKTGYSTNAEVLETLKDAHPIVQAILDYRQIAKLKSTYVDGLLKLVTENGCIHTSFNQTVTATGRLSSTAPNLQNIPVRTEEGRRIRQAFVPTERYTVLLSADYSQIELRVLAHLSGDDGLIESFRKGEDIHRRTASEVFHVPMEEVTSAQRRTAKAVNFGIIYGQTDYGLSRELGISRREAAEYIEKYFARYPQVQHFINETISQTRTDGYVTTMLGRRRYIKDINSRNRNLRHFAERTAVNSPIQGTAADIIKLAMLRCDQEIRERGLDARMLLQVHDELIFEVNQQNAAALVVLVRQAMEEVVDLDVPLQVDFKAGFNWNEMEKI